MNLPDTLLDTSWYLLGWFGFLCALGVSVWRAPWSRLADGGQMNVWLGSIVALMLLWSMKAGVMPGLNLHLLGAMLLCLMVGPWLAIPGLTLALIGITVNGAAGWEALGLNGLLMIVVPVTAAWLLHRTGARILPRNVFVYIFANGFFGSALSILVTGAVICGVLGLSGAYTLDRLGEDYLPYFLLLGFSEAWLAGMVLTLMVIYRPDWVVTFDDASYLNEK